MTDFWRRRRVFVTGHTGFKGSWLTMMLHRYGAQVAGFALEPPTVPSLFALARVAEASNTQIGDVRDLSVLGQALKSSEPEIVIHMAAQPLVRASYNNPVDTYAVNVMGTVNVLEAVRTTPSVRAVIVVTTDKCYENNEWVWPYREGDALGGADPYASSKACAELVTAAYRRSFFRDDVAIATVRAGNVIGGGDWAEDRIVPDIVRAFEVGQPVSVRNPSATRPWQHVLEPLSGYLQLARALHEHALPSHVDARAWNFGPDLGDVRPVSSIVDLAVECWGGTAAWTNDEREHPHEAATLSLDSSKARRVLGWEPKLRVTQAVQWTVEWYRDVLARNADARERVMSDIERFERL